jgi:translation initiation factor 5B
MAMIRQPIVSVLGHVDHGKTTLLDKIRQTAVAAKEAGGITQAIGATEIPSETINKIAGVLLKKYNIQISIPGLLFIDTPGHEAFTSLRRRGGSIADLAILVIDIKEGFQAQTEESLSFLKEFKTPFVVAATKVDRIDGWRANKDSGFFESFQKQQQFVKENLEKLVYRIVGQLSEKGFDSERYDRVQDFKKNVAIVPCSGITGEGIPDLLMILSGLSQQFLKEELEITSEIGQGSVLEVKEIKGLGTTIDVILYDGEIRKGDWLIIGGKEPLVTKIKALLKPPSMRELRVEKQFDYVDHVSAAAGIKISAPGLENAVAGSPIASVHNEKDVERIKKELQEAVERIEFETTGEGVILKADNLGSLEALIHILKQKNISIKKADVGKILRKDLMEIEAVKDSLKRVIIAFNVGMDEAIEKDAKDKNIRILRSNIIYHLIEDYDKFLRTEKERIRQEKLNSIVRPAVVKILPGHTFHISNPAVVGVEILEGMIKSGYKLQKNGKEIGEIKAIQSENQSLEKAEKGQKVAISIEGPVVGRHIKEGDKLETIISKKDLRILEELEMWGEVEIAKRIMNI